MKTETVPLVSILIANYNNGAFIEEALKAAILQTYPHIEIIIVDDASSDQSIEIIERFMKAHPESRIQLFKNNTTYGCGWNKRTCIEKAQGAYFAFLDPDDTIELTAIEELMSIHQQNPFKYSIVYSTHYLCNEKMEIQSVSDWPGKILEGQSHLTSIQGHISAFALCNRFYYDQTSGINETYLVAEDMDLYLKMEEVAPVFFVNKPLYYYRKHDHNLSWDYNKRYNNLYWRHKAEMEAYKRRKKQNTLAANLTWAQLNQRKFAFYMQLAKWHRIQKKYFHAIGYNLKAFPIFILMAYHSLFINQKNKLLLKIRQYRVRRFIDTYDKQKLEKQFHQSINPTMIVIKKGLYEYGYFNFTFLNNMLSLIVTELSRNHFPIVQLDDRKEGWTNWDTFFEQPLKLNGTSHPINQNSTLQQGLISPSFLTPFNERDLKRWQKIYQDFVMLNHDTQQYVEKEYDSFIAGKNVMGVLCRGTDYIKKKPYGHPIQPDPNEVIALVKQKMIDLNLEYIYLATEEYRIVKQFEAEFPGKIIVNQRTYYDEIFEQMNYSEIYQVQFHRENDLYWKGLEYLSSIWLLSRCDALIAGNCGGSTSALYLNNGKYKYWYLFNLGMYGDN